MKKLLLAVGIAAAILSACGSNAVVAPPVKPTPTISASPSPVISPTPPPTAPASSTPSPAPSSTPVPAFALDASSVGVGYFHVLDSRNGQEPPGFDGTNIYAQVNSNDVLTASLIAQVDGGPQQLVARVTTQNAGRVALTGPLPIVPGKHVYTIFVVDDYSFAVNAHAPTRYNSVTYSTTI